MYIYQLGYTALMWGAKNGHILVCQLLLDAGADTEAVDKV
jgi:ankyrin repeat protein